MVKKKKRKVENTLLIFKEITEGFILKRRRHMLLFKEVPEGLKLEILSVAAAFLILILRHLLCPQRS